MGQQVRQARVLEKLIDSLATVRGGSRELDIVVSFVLGDDSSESGRMIHLMVEEGYPWNIISELLDHGVPAYTSSLDATLPGENVVLSMFSPKRSKWAAVQKTAGRTTIMAWAATECLARRRAALMTLNGAIRKPRDPAAVVRAPADSIPVKPLFSGPNPPSSAGSGGPEAEAEEKEWKILF